MYFFDCVKSLRYFSLTGALKSLTRCYEISDVLAGARMFRRDGATRLKMPSLKQWWRTTLIYCLSALTT